MEISSEPIRLSESFPPNTQKNNCYQALVHKTLKDVIPIKFDPQNLIIRGIKTRKELEEIELLHKEWFPINYSTDYFEGVIKGRTKCLLAELKVVKTNRISEKIIVGCIFYDIRLAHAKYMSFSMKDFFKTFKCIYIMTIGVINEYRKHGIASMLLREAIKQTSEKENGELKYVYLHVVEYNNSAQIFYEKNNFTLIKVKKKHYFIEEKDYDAHIYVLYLNGTKKPLTKIERLKIILKMINFPSHLLRCFKMIFSYWLPKKFQHKNIIYQKV